MSVLLREKVLLQISHRYFLTLDDEEEEDEKDGTEAADLAAV
jgi:hypothetical protein